jgi:tetratricopeptide (TPR) repeat protein
MIHHYELGLLTNEEQELVEQHLLDCDECFASFSEFQKAARHIRFSPEIKDLIGQLDADSQKAPTEQSQAERKLFWGRERSSVFVPMFVIAVLTILLLVLKPWHVEFRSTQEAVAAESRLAIMYFDNLTDSEDTGRLGEIVTSLLIADLTDSRYIQVVSSQRLFDIMMQLNHEEKKSVDRGVATQIAQRAQAKWMLTGKIIQVEPKIILTYEVIETSTGDVVASDQLTGAEGESVFSLIDKMTANIRNAGALPEAARQEKDRLVTDITTTSTEAYRHYLEGVEYFSKWFYHEAAESFEKALEYDSAFAMAYYYLSKLTDLTQIDKAVEFSSRTTRLEKYYIDSRKATISGDIAQSINILQNLVIDFPEEKSAYYTLGVIYFSETRYKEAKDNLQQAIDIDSFYKEAINQLAYTFDRLGDFENSILTINRYISLVPNEPNPYDSRGDLYARSGKLDRAIESYQKALEIKPDYYASLRKTGNMYLFQAEFDSAWRCYDDLAATIDTGYSLRKVYPALIPYYQGKFTEAIEAFDNLIEEQKENRAEADLSYSYRIKAHMHYQQGRLDLAVAELKKSVEVCSISSPHLKIHYRNELAQFLADSGDYAEASELAEALYDELDHSSKDMYAYWYAIGAIALAQNQNGEAVIALEKSAEFYKEFPVSLMLARAYLESKNYERAVEVLENSIIVYDESDRLCLGPWNVQMHYYLGLAYEHSRWYQKAVDQYETFLKFWQDADPGIETADDARQRLARLKSRI